ncbi:hypothetical protein ACJX0J_013543, partial [Zea mays]
SRERTTEKEYIIIADIVQRPLYGLGHDINSGTCLTHSILHFLLMLLTNKILKNNFKLFIFDIKKYENPPVDERKGLYKHPSLNHLIFQGYRFLHMLSLCLLLHNEELDEDDHNINKEVKILNNMYDTLASSDEQEMEGYFFVVNSIIFQLIFIKYCQHTKKRKEVGLIGIFCFFASIIEVFKLENVISEIFVINGDDDIAMQYANLFNCQIGTFPMIWKKDLLVGRVTTIDNLDKKGRSSFGKVEGIKRNIILLDGI